MIDINSMASALKIGENFKNSYDGQRLQQSLFDLKEKLADDTFTFYMKIVKNYAYNHFYSFEFAYEHIKINCEKCDDVINDFYIELKKCEEIHSIIRLGNEIGNDFNEAFLSILRDLPVKNSNKLFYTFSIFRSWLDLFYNLHRTKFLYFTKKKFGDDKSKDEFTTNFLKRRNEKIFSSHNRELINLLAHDDQSKSDLWKIEFFGALKTGILQLIFEVTLDFHLVLQKNNASYYKELEIGQLKIVKIKFNKPVNMFKGGSILIYNDDEIIDIGIILNGSIEYSENKARTLSVITALIYPEIDKNIFIN